MAKDGHFLFPRADTSGCTKDPSSFPILSKILPPLYRSDWHFKDTSQKQAKFLAKYYLKCHIGTDHNTDVCEQFGVWVEKSMYGRAYMGVQRATFVIDASGKVLAVWPKVNVNGHAAEVLAFVQTM